ncbi:MAG: hypothetical protein K2X48_05605 [Chitinophagaceae bacterium]|nr:hypothetical protein [Chitinophagaceae bacterium]
MKKATFITFFLLKTCLVQSQDSVFVDSFKLTKSVLFKKVNPSFNEANSALLQLTYDKSNEKLQIKFIVPNFWYRGSTTVSDYFEIQSGNEILKFRNSNEFPPINKDKLSIPYGIGLYVFYTELMLKDPDKLNFYHSTKVKFIFMPNQEVKEEIIKKSKGKKLTSFQRHTINVSQKQMTITISKPQLNDIEALKNWLDSLRK